jgi:hypothetical protein
MNPTRTASPEKTAKPEDASYVVVLTSSFHGDIRQIVLGPYTKEGAKAIEDRHNPHHYAGVTEIFKLTKEAP